MIGGPELRPVARQQPPVILQEQQPFVLERATALGRVKETWMELPSEMTEESQLATELEPALMEPLQVELLMPAMGLEAAAKLHYQVTETFLIRATGKGHARVTA